MKWYLNGKDTKKVNRIMIVTTTIDDYENIDNDN